MKNKYIINICVPILNKSFEMFVPNNILLGNLLYIFVDSIEELKNNKDILFLKFYDSFSGIEMNLNQFVFSCIDNGSKLILI